MNAKAFGFLVAALLCAQSATGAVIFDSGVPAQSELRSSVRNIASGTAWFPDWRATKFELTDSYALTGFSTWASVQTAGLIRWAIYSDAGNPPGEFGFISDLGPFLWSVESQSPVATDDPAWVGVDGFAVELAVGTYWLALEIPIGEPTYLVGRPGSMSDGTAPPNPLLDEAITGGYRAWPNIEWISVGTRHGYRIYGHLVDDHPSVPEPGTLALLSLGLFGLGLSRRRLAA